MTDNDALRQQAEALTRESAAPSPEQIEAMSPEATRAALHELRVHQIELEMQNEELRRTQAELDAARARYFDLYDLAPVGYITLSEQGLILEANLTAATLLGVARGTPGQRPISRFIFKEDQDLYYRLHHQLFETTPPTWPAKSCDLRLVKQDGTARVAWVHLEATLARDAQGEPVGRVVLSDITARQQAAEALRENEHQLRLIADNIPAIVNYVNAQDLRYRFVNRMYADLFDLSPEHLIGKQVSEILDEDAFARALPLINRVRAGEQHVMFENIVTVRGAPRWFSINYEPEFDEYGVVQNIIILAVDITARKQAEEALRESEEKYRGLVQGAPDAIVIYRDGQIVFANAASVQLMRARQVADLVGRSVIELIHPDYREFVIQRMIAVRQARQPLDLAEEKFIRLDGTAVDVEVKAIPLTFERRPAGQIIARDITDRKRAEEALQRYEFIANAATESMTLINRQHVFESVNDAYCRTQGRPRDQLIGHSLAEVWGVTRYREKILPYLEQCFAGHIVRYEDTFPFEGGEPRYYQMGMYPYSTAPGGPVTYAVIVTFDITERKQAEEALRASNAELQTHNEELNAFAHTVAHDLKTPLSIVVGYAELLASGYHTLPTDEIQQYLAVITRNGRKADDIIEALLLLASVRKQDVRVASLDMAHIIDEVALRLTDLIRTSGADLHVLDRAGWPVALGYAPWIEEIWANYLSNALKYGGLRPRIELSATRQPDGFVRFSVRDYGPGLTPEQQARLFAPFERLGQASVKGHGLGLSVVRRIANKLGGQAGVDSQPGQGSAFYFTLPAA